MTFFNIVSDGAFVAVRGYTTRQLIEYLDTGQQVDGARYFVRRQRTRLHGHVYRFVVGHDGDGRALLCRDALVTAETFEALEGRRGAAAALRRARKTGRVRP